MFLGGIWHGAAWTFVIWGLIHGGALAIERALGRAGGVFATFHIVCFAWIFFRAETLEAAGLYLGGLGRLTTGFEATGPAAFGLIAGALAWQFSWPRGLEHAARKLRPVPSWALGALFAVSLLAIYWLAPAGTAPFIYFRF
jgi:hypothetical protein